MTDREMLCMAYGFINAKSYSNDEDEFLKRLREHLFPSQAAAEEAKKEARHE